MLLKYFFGQVEVEAERGKTPLAQTYSPDLPEYPTCFLFTVLIINQPEHSQVLFSGSSTSPWLGSTINYNWGSQSQPGGDQGKVVKAVAVGRLVQ